jgi:hypothetical protein
MNTQLATTAGLPSIIERAALDPEFDIEKLQRLLDMNEASEIRNAEKAFTSAHAAAEAEMETINTDANNPQTRSKYATFAQVDRAARPIYTRHGFGISFTTEPMGTPDSLLVVGTLSHRGGSSRRFQVPVPIVTKGIQGREMMTPIHATMAAISYGKRNLEIMMFNLAVGDDNDGNVPRRPPPRPIQEHVDRETGEVTTTPMEHQTPGLVEWVDGADTWATWTPRFTALLRTSTTLDEVQQWLDLNLSTLNRMKQEKPASHENIRAGVDAFRKGFAA